MKAGQGRRVKREVERRGGEGEDRRRGRERKGWDGRGKDWPAQLSEPSAAYGRGH
jgi:hypothetical protein